jgi:hypothetical protein
MRNEYDFKRGKRGAILPASTGKTRITIRLDDDILENPLDVPTELPWQPKFHSAR